MQLTLILGRRLLGAAALIAAVLVLNFVLIHLAPGDPALTIAGGMGGATEEMLRDIRQAYGLDRPLHQQLLVYMARTLSGGLGHSLFFDTPVIGLILARLGPTILLVMTAMSIALGLRDMPLFDTPAGLPGGTDPDCPGALRARLLRAGREAVDDRELLQLLLSWSHPAGDARALSGTLLDVFGSPARVLAARPDTLRAVAGLDETSIAAIKIAEALGIRLARAELPDELHPTLDGYAKVVDYCRALTGHRQVEHLYVLFLNSRNRLIRDERHSSGTVNHTPAYPREICTRALELNAAALILVHDHPSGEPSPSRSDIDMTNRIRDAAKLIDVALHDHIVVTPTDAFSFREKGLL